MKNANVYCLISVLLWLVQNGSHLGTLPGVHYLWMVNWIKEILSALIGTMQCLQLVIYYYMAAILIWSTTHSGPDNKWFLIGYVLWDMQMNVKYQTTTKCKQHNSTQFWNSMTDGPLPSPFSITTALFSWCLCICTVLYCVIE